MAPALTRFKRWTQENVAKVIEQLDRAVITDKPRRRIDADPAKWQALRNELHALALDCGPDFLDLARQDYKRAAQILPNYPLSVEGLNRLDAKTVKFSPSVDL